MASGEEAVLFSRGENGGFAHEAASAAGFLFPERDSQAVGAALWFDSQHRVGGAAMGTSVPWTHTLRTGPAAPRDPAPRLPPTPQAATLHQDNRAQTQACEDLRT